MPLLHHLAAAAALGHGGRFTWDEALMVAVPIAIFAAVLVTANKRASALQARQDADAGAPPEEADDRGGAEDVTAGGAPGDDAADRTGSGDGIGTPASGAGDGDGAASPTGDR